LPLSLQYRGRGLPGYRVRLTTVDPESRIVVPMMTKLGMLLIAADLVRRVRRVRRRLA